LLTLGHRHFCEPKVKLVTAQPCTQSLPSPQSPQPSLSCDRILEILSRFAIAYRQPCILTEPLLDPNPSNLQAHAHRLRGLPLPHQSLDLSSVIHVVSSNSLPWAEFFRHARTAIPPPIVLLNPPDTLNASAQHFLSWHEDVGPATPFLQSVTSSDATQSSSGFRHRRSPYSEPPLPRQCLSIRT
jgi:hypothetical protein